MELQTLLQPETWNQVMYILLAIIVLLWIYTILWVAKDISWRTTNFAFQLFAILLVLFGTPLVGLPLYFLIRPMQYHHRVRDDAHVVTCYACHRANDTHFAFCVFCGEGLKIACPHCGKAIGNDYVYCAWCGDEVVPTKKDTPKEKQ